MPPPQPHLPSLFFLLSSLISSLAFASGLPLSAHSRWIVHDDDGSRVKLACVNWVSHLQPMLAEGLSKQPLDAITSTIRSLGFNCVRLTWATFMFTDPTLGQQTVEQSFTALNLTSALAGIVKNNPQLVSLPVVEAFKAVVSSLGKNGVMAILDNHVSKPQWCCGNTDGNGFFGDKYFDPDVWAQGLHMVASTFRDSPQVVAISMRNELRGPKENAQDWYKYMQMGAEAVHSANPNVLIIHSGLNFDSDLRFLASQQLNEPFRNKVVYEVHWYAFTNGNAFATGNLNHVCASITKGVIDKSGYLVTESKSYTGPLFISEFGIDERGINQNDNRYIACFFAFAASGDFDWAYWPLQGSYYIRDGKQDNEEFYGILTSGWDAPRNVSFLNRLQSLQQSFIEDISSSSNISQQILFHPASGLCLQKDDDNRVTLRSCEYASNWRYNSQGQIVLEETSLCVAAEGEGQAAKVTDCGSETNWQLASETEMQFSTLVGNDNLTVCLDGSSPPAVLASKCICENGSQCGSEDDPSAQWFKLVPTTRASVKNT